MTFTPPRLTIADMRANAEKFGPVATFSKFANNSYRVTYEGEPRTVRYFHQTTPVVTIRAGQFIVSTGGWETSTTTDRINYALNPYGYRANRLKGTIWLRGPGLDAPIEANGATLTVSNAAEAEA